MSFKIFRTAPMIVLAGIALSSAAWGKCSNSSMSGIYGYLGGGTDSDGTPTAALIQVTFDPSTGMFSGTGTISHDGAIETGSLTGQYAVASNCTVTGTLTVGSTTEDFSAVVTSTGGVKLVIGKTGATNGGFLMAQGSPKCTNAGIKGSLGFVATGVFVTGASFTGPVDLIGELALSVNKKSGDGVISGEVAGSEDGTILTFADEPVTGSYSVSSDCLGTLSITPEGQSALNFSFVVVDSGKEIVAIETDADTVVTGTLQK